MKVSLILASYKRPHLLDLTLRSIAKQVVSYPLQIVVVNDGVEDETKTICNSFPSLDIKYVFSGHRNANGDLYRVAGFANNIGVKQSDGDIIIVSCAEVLQLNNVIDILVTPLLKQKKFITTPRFMWFDDDGEYTKRLAQKTYLSTNNLWTKYFTNKEPELPWFGTKGIYSVNMPYCMGMWRHAYTNMGGYDEDFIGNACDDNDFVDRLVTDGYLYYYTDAQIIHMYHGKTSDGLPHYDDPKWVYNFMMYEERKGIIKRNENIEWGLLDTEKNTTDA